MSQQPLLFIDRDGTLVEEPVIDKQLDSLEKLVFEPHVLPVLLKLQQNGFSFSDGVKPRWIGNREFPSSQF